MDSLSSSGLTTGHRSTGTCSELRADKKLSRFASGAADSEVFGLSECYLFFYITLQIMQCTFTVAFIEQTAQRDVVNTFGLFH